MKCLVNLQSIAERIRENHHSNTTTHIQLHNFSHSISRILKQHSFPKPLRCNSFNNKQWIILSTPAPSFNTKNGVYIFDVLSHIWQLYCRYPRSIRLRNHNHTLDQNNYLLYIFGGTLDTFVILDLKSKTWKYKLENNINFPLIPSLGYSVTYNRNYNTFMDAIELSVYDLYKMIRKKFENNLFSSSVIILTNENDSQNKWFNNVCCEIKSNNKDTYIILIYGYILVIYCLTNVYNICCIDLLYKNSCVINKSNDLLLKIDSFHFVKKCAFGLLNIHDGLINCKWMLNEIIPKQWKKYYHVNYDKLLVFGYIRKTQIVPICVSQLVYELYPGYLEFMT